MCFFCKTILKSHDTIHFLFRLFIQIFVVRGWKQFQTVRTLTPSFQKQASTTCSWTANQNAGYSRGGSGGERPWNCRSLGRHVKAFWLHPLFCAALSMLTPLQPESGKVAVVNPDWQGHYRIPPHTSNEYGYSQTSLCACTHLHAHANLRRFSRCFCQLTSPTVHVAASCCHHAEDSTATKAQQRVPANISTDETF